MIDTMLGEWAEWIAATPLSLYLQQQVWILIASQTIHIVGIAVLFGPALLIATRLLGLNASGRRVSELVATSTPWIYGALIVLLVTGVEQIIAAPERQLMTQEFRWKMLLLAIATIATVSFTRSVRARAGAWDDAATQPPGTKLFAAAWLGTWIAIIYFGRFIGYAF